MATTWKFLRGKGLTPAQAAGIIGSMQGESGPGLDPAAQNPAPSHALGIAQWLGGRKTAAVRSKQLGPQLEHLWQELQGPERKAFQSIKNAKTVEEAAVAWQRDYERGAPFEQKYDQRVANARKVLQRMHGVAGADNVTSGLMSDRVNGHNAAADRLRQAGLLLDQNQSLVSEGVGSGLEKKDTPLNRYDAFEELNRGGSILDFAQKIKSLRDADVQAGGTGDTGSHGLSLGDALASQGGDTGGTSHGVKGGKDGVARITGPNPGRIQPQVTNFMKAISAQLGGREIVGSDGTGHSYLTVNGNVSEHSLGKASDIPAKGARLLHYGQAALIAAGMPKEQALRQRGGLFNVHKDGKRYQIIFNTNEGGNHFDHLHVGVHGE